ncbi:alpha/beta hydrolase-fold protein [bacterium]|nr:alpha/beta hydrolase-fold protein [Akkermansiaceae bacterium]MDB4525441.1 alpha/beta hydrolase-fold protein [Akkermansiaceae bacterium]MDB4547278.1 alpha/beta hydrolase-fold protein [Akkermansiaceae bacterium]MDB4587950.1 alpha/beta hydrolase-fold protein [bacterium]MDB4725131.1 alpha/beta hydrolase-fold protein [Akkermansiaceae bacterium]
MLKSLFLIACLSLLASGQTKYTHGPDSKVKKDVPQGKVTRYDWKSKIYEGTLRQFYVYVPAQYDGSKEAAVMVFQDGHAYVGPNGSFKASTVMDNLIAAGEMPVTIGIFVNPGLFTDKIEGRQDWGTLKKKSNRANEYDSLGSKYAQFLEKEILPEVSKTLKLSSDPKMRAICGSSSGGICAFTVAWERPDLFQKVISHIGSFTNIKGGHVYPALVRKDEKRDIRVFLQDGSGDLDNKFGNWWLANLQMENSLKFREYDYKFVGGDGGHNGEHGGAIFPDTLRWIWR